MPGEPLPTDVRHPQSGSFQRLVGHEALEGLAQRYGVAGQTVPDQVRNGGDGYLDEVAGRLAVGAAAIAVVLDPGLIVLSGDIGRAGGERLAAKVEEAVARVCPSTPRVVTSGVAGNPVLRGALVAALDQAREQVFSDTV